MSNTSNQRELHLDWESDFDGDYYMFADDVEADQCTWQVTLIHPDGKVEPLETLSVEHFSGYRPPRDPSSACWYVFHRSGNVEIRIPGWEDPFIGPIGTAIAVQPDWSAPSDLPPEWFGYWKEGLKSAGPSWMSDFGAIHIRTLEDPTHPSTSGPGGITSITGEITRYWVGSITFEQLLTELGTRQYLKPRVSSPPTIEDLHRVDPGNFREVWLAVFVGLLTRQEFDAIHQAVMADGRPDPEDDYTAIGAAIVEQSRQDLASS